MDFKFDELKQMLEKSDGFMINVTVRNVNKLNHYLYTEKFFDGDMLPSSVEAEQLIVNRLKNRRNVVEEAQIVEEKDGNSETVA